MPRYVKRTYDKWTVTALSPRPLRRGGPLETIPEVNPSNELNSNENNASDPFDKLLNSPMKREVSLKPLSFWGRKVEELKSKEKESTAKGLYELSSPDETLPKNKKTYRKPKPQKKKENLLDNILRNVSRGKKNRPVPEKPNKNEGALIKERILYKKVENENDLNDSMLTFKQQLPIFGLSSTPGKTKRPNVVKPSYFDFVSPIIGDISKIDKNTPNNSTIIKQLSRIDTGEPDDTPKRVPSVEVSRMNPSSVDANRTENFGENAFTGFSPCDLPNSKESILTWHLDRNVTLRRKKQNVTLEKTDFENKDPSSQYSNGDSEVLGRNIAIADNEENVNTIVLQKRVTRASQRSPEHESSKSSDSSKSFDGFSVQKESKKDESLFVTPDSSSGNANDYPLDWCVTKRKRTNKSRNATIEEQTELVPSKKQNSILESSIIKNDEISPYFPNVVLMDTPSSSSDSSLILKTPENINDETRRNQNHVQFTRDSLDNSPNFSPVGNKTFLPAGPLVLKGGKGHTRALSVLRQINAGRLTLHNQSMLPQAPPGRGRGYESFVGGLLEVQPGFEGSILGTVSPLQNRSSRRPATRSRSVIAKKSTTHKTWLENRQSVASRTLKNADGPMNRTIQWRNSVKFDRKQRQTTIGLHETCMDKSHFGNVTVCVVAAEPHEPTAFRSAYGIEDKTAAGTPFTCTAREATLARCGQSEPLDFSEHFNEKTLPDCVKIGEGVYGEVFMYNSTLYGPTVFKVIPIEGELYVNDEPQKTFEQILSEVVITMELSNLRSGVQQNCSGFVQVRRCMCVKGEYPEMLLDLWCDYDVRKGSDNDSPSMFEEDQLYIVLELAHGGQDLEAFVFSSAKQSAAAFRQATLSLAVAERALQFEHRDFHWGNVLLSTTTEKTEKYILDGQEYVVATEGVKVTIIDFTLSRMTFEGCSVFNDLSVDPELFTSEGDYQFQIYRMMKEETGNDWKVFCPRTNIFWLHYTLDKMLTMVRYPRLRTKSHSDGLRKLRVWKKSILDYTGAVELVSLL